MNQAFYFDAATVFIVVLLLFTIIVRKVYKTPSSKIFISMLICTFVAALFEIPTCFTNVFNHDTLVIFKSVYFLARLMMPTLFMLYIIAVTDSWDYIRKRIYLLLLVVVPFVTVMLLILTNPLSNGVFYYDGVEYHRGALIFILYLISAYYLIVGFIYTLLCRKFFNRFQVVALVSVAPFNTLAVIIQILNKNILIELFATTLSFIMICSAIENPNEQLDIKTNLLSDKKYMSRLYVSYVLKTDVFTVLIKIINYSSIYTLLSYNNARKYIKFMANNLDKRYRNEISKYTAYSLEDGLFAINCDSYDEALKFAELAEKDMHNSSKVLDFNPMYHICITNVTSDFKDLSEFRSFISNYRSRFTFKDRVVEIKNIKENKAFIIESNIDTIVDDGIKNNEFVVFYQPIYSVKEKKIISAEALVRLNSKKYGFISPDLFIESAEKNRKINLIDNFVFEEVIKFISEPIFDEIGLKYLETNLSIVDCVAPNIYRRINELLDKYDVDGEKVNIELTETVDADKKAIDNNVKLLKGIGINFSLDDYGTGYSNLDRFINLPLSIVKVDKSLVYRYEDDTALKVLSNTIKMIKDLGRDVLIEGVETKEQAQAFIGSGCDYIQGYYYSEPLTKEKFIEYVKMFNNIKN